MKLSEYKDEDAIELLADLLEPVAEICSDKKIADAYREKKTNIEIVQIAMKNHTHALMNILAILDGVPVEEYHCNLFSLPKRLMEIMNDKDMMDFFASQGQKEEQDASGSVMESTKETEKE